MKTIHNYSYGTKILSLILSLLVIFYLVPTSVFAETLTNEASEPASVTTATDEAQYTPIVYEVTELRETNVKHFRLEDGTYVAAQYDYPVHYVDENGQLVDINNRLFDSGSDFTTENSRIKFAKKISGNGNIFTLHENNTKIIMGLSGAVKKTPGVVTNNSSDSADTPLGKLTRLENISSTILYEDILDGVDIEYIVHSLNVKENIIVKDKKNEYSYTFTLELNNLTASLDENGNIYIISDSGKTQYVIPKPIVFDANGTYAPDNASAYTLSQTGNGKYELVVNVDSSWMNSDERVFPVTIDPPMLATSGAVVDLNIDAETPNTNTNGQERFYVSSTQRAYVKFNENNFVDIPSGATIIRAELSIISYYVDTAGARVGAYEITTDWDETLTWNKTVSATPQGAFSNSALDYDVINDNGHRHTWNITSLYKKWLNGGNNYGVGLRLVDESATNESARFTAYDYRPLIPDELFYDPSIQVTYVYTDGLESYYPTVTHSAGTGGAGSINLLTGKLTLAIPTLTTTDALFAFTPTLVYNSSLAGEQVTKYNTSSAYSESYMPNGFKLNIQETVVRKNYYDSDGYYNTYYVLHDADGSTHRFYQTVSILPYYDDDGLRLSLTENSTDNALTITDVDGNYKTYSYFGYESWYLTSITDKYGNSLVFEFDEYKRPDAVSVQPIGMDNIPMLQLSYKNGKLSKVYNSASKESVILTYSNGNLAFVQYCYGDEGNDGNGGTEYASASYTYDANGYITKIEDSQAEKSLEYEITDGKITKISEKAGTTLGQQVSYTYCDSYTNVLTTGNDEILNTADDIITRYVFDSYGRSASVYSISADEKEIYGATSGSYENSLMNKNSIKSSVVYNGVDSKSVINEESDSTTPLSVTISGGVNTDEATGVYRRTVRVEDNNTNLAQKEFVISAFAEANSVVMNSGTKFSIGVEIYYYQSDGADDEVVEYHFDFADAENVKQFVTGRFSCNYANSNGTPYNVRKIDIVLYYYGHLNVGVEEAEATFSSITFAEFKDGNGYDYLYDESTGNLTDKGNSLYQESYEYDGKNRITRISNSYGEVCEHTYKEENGITTHVEKHLRNNSPILETSYTYNSYGLLTNSSNSGEAKDYYYIEDYETVYLNTEYEYITSPGSKIFGTLCAETNSLGYTTVYELDSDKGLLLHTFNQTSGKGYKYTYDDTGKLTSVRPIIMNDEAVVQPENVNYTYNNKGYLSQIATDSTTYSMIYDGFGNATGVEIGDRTLATYEYYSNNGKIKKINYGNGFSEEYVYNTLEMLSEIWYTYSQGTREKAYTYTYNSDRNIENIKNHLDGTSVCFNYDARGRLTSVYDADENGDPTGVQNGVGYDADNRIINQTFNLSSTTSFVTSYNYDSSGNLTTETLEYLSDNHKINYEYDNFNRLSSVSSDFGAFDYTNAYSYYSTTEENTSTRVGRCVSEINGNTTTYTYDYDPRGNITVITQGSTTTNYYYDDIGQLTGESNGITTRYYTYDNAGNIVSIKNQPASLGGGGLIIRAALPSLQPLITTLGYTDSEWGDLLTSYNGTTITYDEIGNPLSYYNGTAYTFTWEGRRLVGAVKGTKTMSFTYNDEGIRTSKTVNGVTHTYYLNGSLIMAEQWEDKLLVYLYDASGSPIGMMYRTESYASDAWDTFWYEKNLFGDIVAIYNESGTKVATYTYRDAWGNHTVTYQNGGGSTGAQYNPFRYRGYYYDTDLGMYYLQSRYYDATICRFINADGYVSTGQGILGNNMFAYCNNNPVMYVDPNGEYCVANKDSSDTNYLDDWLIEGAGAGGYGGTGNYFGYGTSYYSYSIRNYSSATNNPRYYIVAGAVSVNDGMAVGSSGTTIIYRSVSSAEALDIKNTGQFNISPNGMDCKQFGFDYGETAQFGQKVGQNIIVSARIPTSSLGRFYTQGVDTSIFRHGTLTVYGDDIGYFNQLIAGTIVFYR